jgi:NADH dehydrogenase FAD-containing subunit
MKHLILLGGGHTHVHILKQLLQHQWPDTRITLISPDPYQYYSGMFSGYIENKYELEEIRIDLRLLCKRAKVDFKAASADRLDPQKQEMMTCSGERIQYDLISFDIGSLTANHKIPGLQESGTFIKPNFRVPQIKIAFETEERVVVVGGGASGIEMSLSLQARRNQLNVKIPVTLTHSGRLLESYGEQASRHITDIVHKKAVQLFQNDPVISVDGNHLMLKSGNCISFDRLL